VDNTHGAVVFAYDVQSDGMATNRRAFTTLHDISANKPSGADGIAIDSEDRMYVSTLTGVQVFDSKGQYLGTISAPRQPANVALSGPGKQTLYITAREGLYRINMMSKGPDRLGK
jgi:gluconolactonase